MIDNTVEPLNGHIGHAQWVGRAMLPINMRLGRPMIKNIGVVSILFPPCSWWAFPWNQRYREVIEQAGLV